MSYLDSLDEVSLPKCAPRGRFVKSLALPDYCHDLAMQAGL